MDTVRSYLEAIYPENRPLFDRVHRLVLYAHPDPRWLPPTAAAGISGDDLGGLVGGALDA